MQKRSVNKVIIVGRLGQDPEVRYSKNGNAVANLSVATTHSRKQGEDYKDETTWHKVVLFGSQAEFAKEYINKGNLVSVVGRINTNKWQDKNGNTRSQKQIICRELNLYSSNKSNNNQQETEDKQEQEVDDNDEIPF